MDEILTSVVYGAVVLGAFLSTWVGKTKAKEPYDVSQFISSLIIAALAATATVNVERLAEQLSQLGWVGTGVAYIVVGFLLDKGLSRLDKQKK